MASTFVFTTNTETGNPKVPALKSMSQASFFARKQTKSFGHLQKGVFSIVTYFIPCFISLRTARNYGSHTLYWHAVRRWSYPSDAYSGRTPSQQKDLLIATQTEIQTSRPTIRPISPASHNSFKWSRVGTPGTEFPLFVLGR